MHSGDAQMGITEPDDDGPVWLDDDRDDETTFWRDVREEAAHGHMQPTPSAAVDEREAMRRVALTVPCRDCHAAIKVPCHQVGDPTSPLRKFPAHPHRMSDARKAQQ